MKRRLSSVILILVALAGVAGYSEEGDPLESAEALFETYVRLEHSYDKAVADLYSDEAVIKNTRRYPWGQSRVIEIEEVSESRP